jgi:hypothetical protein
MLAWDLFVKLYDECFHIYVNACRLALLLLQYCVNMVFRHDLRPPSFSLISRAIMLHWLVYKLSNVPYFSCTIKNC